MQLGEVASVRSGLVLSRKLSNDTSQYRYQLINLRAINNNAYIEMNELDVYDAKEKLSSEYLTHLGDIIIRLSSPYTAVLIDKMTEGLLYSSNFVVIRSNNKIILPEYLFWLLNTDKIKKDILLCSAGNMLSAIRPKYFSALEIDLLSMEEQRVIGNMHILTRRENKLLIDLAQEKEKYYKIQINEIQRRMRKENNHDNKR